MRSATVAGHSDGFGRSGRRLYHRQRRRSVRHGRPVQARRPGPVLGAAMGPRRARRAGRGDGDGQHVRGRHVATATLRVNCAGAVHPVQTAPGAYASRFCPPLPLRMVGAPRAPEPLFRLKSGAAGHATPSGRSVHVAGGRVCPPGMRHGRPRSALRACPASGCLRRWISWPYLSHCL